MKRFKVIPKREEQLPTKSIEHEDRTITMTKLEWIKSQNIRLSVRVVMKVQLPYRQQTYTHLS